MRCSGCSVFGRNRPPRDFVNWSSGWAPVPTVCCLESLVIARWHRLSTANQYRSLRLALDEYAHFTSPIRRYPDLLVHRAIKAATLPNSRPDIVTTTAECRRSVRRARSANARRRRIAAM